MRELLLSLLLMLPLGMVAQDILPTVEPTMYILFPDKEAGYNTSYNGNAPMKARFEACPANEGEYSPLYEWRITREGETSPLVTRYDENMDFTFTKSGTFNVKLYVTFVHENDSLEYEMDSPFVISINESQLELPNAFSPNGDGINDIFKVKDTTRSLVEFEATVFNRWGRKLYSWTDYENGGWDGTVGGNGGQRCPDGAYFLHVKAKGADGRQYNRKITINILTGFNEGQGQEGI